MSSVGRGSVPPEVGELVCRGWVGGNTKLQSKSIASVMSRHILFQGYGGICKPNVFDLLL